MSSQPNLFPDRPKRKHRVVLGNQHHEAVDPKIDQPRLLSQYEWILKYMQESGWRTQYEIAEALDFPQGSVGSQIRNARVDGWIIEKRRRSGGTWEYRIAGRKAE